VFAIVGFILTLAFTQQADSSGSGSVTINGATRQLSHVIKTTRKNPFNDFFSDTVVLLSDKPVTEAEAADDALLLKRAQTGDLVTVAVRFDGRPKRGQLFNVGINHQGLSETALLPDVWVKYTFKGGAGTLSMPAHELAGRIYAAELEFKVPMPVETTVDAAAPTSRELPPPSKTDADRQKVSQLLIEALQEGDEARALAIVGLGLDPNAKDSKMGISLINWAVLMCQPPIVNALVEMKADLNHERLPGMTLLAEARAACPEAVGYLKAGGAKD
jgi:hypothetical protein